MHKQPRIFSVFTVLCLLVSPAVSLAKPTMDEMWALVQKQQAQIEQLQARLETTDNKVAETDARIEATSEVVEERSALASNLDKFHFGSYGEMHYNNTDDQSQLDLHRFVLAFGYDFTDAIRFYSELEVEHAFIEDGGGTPGEVELEQAYVEFDLNDYATARGGLFLLPVGILNPTHEPTTFFGVERNNVETNIIPTTWWEGGAALLGDFGEGFHYEATLTTGLNVPTTGSNAFLPRKGLQKGGKADATAPAFTAQLAWRGYPGLELAGSLQYQTDITQGSENVSAVLGEAHAQYRTGPFGIKALYSQWWLNGSQADAIGRDKQYGWYVEPAYYLLDDKVGLFARYESWDNNAGNSVNTDNNQITAGVNWWPIEQVVLKADYQKQDGAANNDGFNLGIGYAVSF